MRPVLHYLWSISTAQSAQYIGNTWLYIAAFLVLLISVSIFTIPFLHVLPASKIKEVCQGSDGFVNTDVLDSVNHKEWDHRSLCFLIFRETPQLITQESKIAAPASIPIAMVCIPSKSVLVVVARPYLMTFCDSSRGLLEFVL